MTYSRWVRGVLVASLLAGACWLPAAFAQGGGKASISVGLTIVADDAKPARNDGQALAGPRIPVDPAHAIVGDDPLRDARVEEVALEGGQRLRVVSY